MIKGNTNPHGKRKRSNNLSYTALQYSKLKCVILIILLTLILISSFIILGFAIVQMHNMTLDIQSIENDMDYLNAEILKLQSSISTLNLLNDIEDFEDDQVYEDNFDSKKLWLNNEVNLEDAYDLNYIEDNDDDIGKVVDTKYDDDDDDSHPEDEGVLTMLKTENFGKIYRGSERIKRSATTESSRFSPKVDDDFKNNYHGNINILVHSSVAFDEDEDKKINDAISTVSASDLDNSKVNNLKIVRRKSKKPQLKSGAQWKPINGQDMIVEDRNSERHGRHNHRQRNNLEILDEGTSQYHLLSAIHFSGDASKYVVGQHINYNGNNHLRHLNQTYVDWVPTNWVKSLNMDQKFHMHDGYLNIKENGLYLVYSQIYYLDEHDINGYRVYKNEEAILQCTTMTHTVGRVIKGNTCFTAGVEYLIEGDQISIRDLSEGRYSLFERGKSFFGLVKLGDVKLN